MSLEQLIALVMSLGGVGSLIAILINIGKTLGWIKDGQASTYTTGAGLFVGVLLFIAGIIKPDLDIAGIDGVVGQVAQIFAMVFSLIWPMLSAKLTHFAVKGTPVLGKSFSREQSAVMKAQASAYVSKAMQRE